MTNRKATIKDRNKLFGYVECVRKGECLALPNVTLLRAAREFHDEGLIALIETIGAAGPVLHIQRNF